MIGHKNQPSPGQVPEECADPEVAATVGFSDLVEEYEQFHPDGWGVGSGRRVRKAPTMDEQEAALYPESDE